jgi:hypothetical protein
MTPPDSAFRRGWAHPAVAIFLAPAAIALAMAGWTVPAWTVLGGLAGYTLSGSV